MQVRGYNRHGNTFNASASDWSAHMIHSVPVGNPPTEVPVSGRYLREVTGRRPYSVNHSEPEQTRMALRLMDHGIIRTRLHNFVAERASHSYGPSRICSASLCHGPG